MKQYWSELKSILTAKTFIVSVLLIALLSYGFAAVNTTVGIDDLEIDRYVGSGMGLLASGRFGTVLWAYLFGYQNQLTANSYAIDFLAVLFLILAAANFCILLRAVAGEWISILSCTVFACFFVSYPLMNEIWEYTGANLTVCGGFLLVSFALLLVHGYLHSTKRKPASLAAAALLMMVVCAGYESLVPVYIFFVFAVLALQIAWGTPGEKKLKTMILQGLVYAAVLVCGLLLRFLVHRLILLALHMEPRPNGATSIAWGQQPAGKVLKYLVYHIVRNYILKGIIYFPLTELLVSIAVFVIIGFFVCRKYGRGMLLPGIGMLLSLIVLSVVQGVVSPYRTCQVFGAFVAFTALLVSVLLQNHSRQRFKWLPNAVLVIIAYICLNQALFVNYFLTLNHIRSEEDAAIIRQIGSELHRDFDMDKPVIFVGSHEVSEDLLEAASISEDSLRWKLYKSIFLGCYRLLGQEYNEDALSRKLPQTNVQSAISWGRNVYNQEGMQHLFSYYGWDYVLADYPKFHQEAEAYVAKAGTPGYPQSGYIVDVGEYIIVNLQ